MNGVNLKLTLTAYSYSFARFSLKQMMRWNWKVDPNWVAAIAAVVLAIVAVVQLLLR